MHDLFDHLNEEFGRYMEMPNDDHHKLSMRSVCISPKYWRDNIDEMNQYDYDWIEVKYDELAGHLEREPETANGVGLYMFMIKPEQTFIGLPCFVFYVGIAGETSSRRSLQVRLKEYLNLSSIKKRAAVHNTLRNYSPNTYVAYSKVNAQPADLRRLEAAFHGYYYPWAGKRDFPIDVKQSQRAWGGV